MTDARPLLAVTAGDPNGIGPEVALKALRDPPVQAVARCVLLGSAEVVAAQADRLGLGPVQVVDDPAEAAGEGAVAVLDVLPGEAADFAFGQVTAEGGRQAMRAVAAAADGCLDGRFDAMVTAPISKEAIRLAGYDFPGHTELLAARTGAARFVMLLVSGEGRNALRVALVTIHEPLAAVARLVTRERVRATLETVHASLRRDFGKAAPRLAVLGLNPHAGEGGVLGAEEGEVIAPALDDVRRLGLDVHGPFPADGFFGRRAYADYDAVVAMYHDQGLAPFKALAMGAGVNVTGGLPIVRTSPDHGTAFGIAGRGLASSDSMREAVLLAAEIARRRARASGP